MLLTIPVDILRHVQYAADVTGTCKKCGAENVTVVKLKEGVCPWLCISCAEKAKAKRHAQVFESEIRQ